MPNMRAKVTNLRRNLAEDRARLLRCAAVKGQA